MARRAPTLARAAALAATLVAMAPAAPAAAEPLPAGRVSAVLGGRTGTGSLYSSIGAGVAWGFEAAYAPLRAPQTIGVGVTWSMLWSYYWGDSAPVSDAMRMVELDLGARVRMMLGTHRRTVLFVGGGPTLIRTNDPLFADGGRSDLGPWGAVGVETGRFGEVVTASLRYAVIRDGQGTVGLMLSVGAGR